jgi:TnpA family transposase
MIRVALSLKQRTAPAHVIVQRLTNSFPADRLSKAMTNLGRILKTQYIVRYLTDRDLRRTVQLQLNKGEYRHKLPRRIFQIPPDLVVKTQALDIAEVILYLLR